MVTLTWRDVFDPKKPLKQDEAMRMAIAVGYKYLAWQGGVYKIEDDEERTWLQLTGNVSDVI